MTSKEECIDAEPTWVYEVDKSSIAAVDDYMKVSVDSSNGLIWVKAMTGPVIETTYTVSITARLPTGNNSSFDLIITVTGCSVTPIIPPVTIPTQTYFV